MEQVASMIHNQQWHPDILQESSRQMARRLDGFKVVAVGYTAANIIDNFPQGDPHGDFKHAGVLDLSCQGKNFSALLVSVPMRANHLPPSVIIPECWQTIPIINQFGQLFIPDCAGNGGRGLGVPRLPETELINAVSSPQTNAPAPRRRSILKLNGVLHNICPSKPSFSACLMAIFNRLIARDIQPHIDISLRCPYGISRYNLSFKYPVRVHFQGWIGP
jgi:hypothetical protein